MLLWFLNLSHTTQALIAGLFTWGVTAAGAAFVFFFKKINRVFMDSMLGFAGGVMIAASFFSLISPAIEMAENINLLPWPTVSAGFFTGGLLIFISDKIFDRLMRRNHDSSSVMKRSFMLMTSITIHNIPEGLAIGVSFGSLAYGLDGATLGAAIMLAVGIGLQNFPEGMAVSIPLRRDGQSRGKSFFMGQLSAAVEPISSVIGAILVMSVRAVLPFFMSFAAGAMIYVVVEEIIPESQSNFNKDLMAIFTLLGFVVMMVLDLSLG